MELNDKQLERLARRLDGEAIELDEQTRHAGQAFRRDEEHVARLLAVVPPAGAMARIQSRVSTELDRSRPGVLRIAAVGASWAAAAAAAVVLAVALSIPDRPTVRVAETATDQGVPLAVVLEAFEDSVETAELELLELEVGELTMELAASDDTGGLTETRMDLLESDVEEFWLRDAGVENPEL